MTSSMTEATDRPVNLDSIRFQLEVHRVARHKLIRKYFIKIVRSAVADDTKKIPKLPRIRRIPSKVECKFRLPLHRLIKILILLSRSNVQRLQANASHYHNKRKRRNGIIRLDKSGNETKRNTGRKVTCVKVFYG